MSQQEQKNNQQEEIDLVGLLGLINSAFQKIGLRILQFINFLMKNLIVLGILLITGIALGFYMESKKGSVYQTEMLLATNFDGGQYLEKAVGEIRFKLGKNDKEFLTETGLREDEGKIVKLTVEPIYRLEEYSNEQYTFMRVFEDTKFLEEEHKKEAFKNSAKRYKLTLVHHLPLNSTEVLERLVEYMRKNSFYSQLYSEYHEDVDMLLHSNIYMMQQLDSLVASYSHSMDLNKVKGVQLDYFNSENDIDLGIVLETRKIIQRDIKTLREEKIASTEFLRIIDKGAVASYSGKSILDNPKILYPLGLILAYFVIILCIRLLKKARSLPQH